MEAAVINQETTHQGLDKIKRYDWQTKGSVGSMQMIDKRLLKVSDKYQRDATPAKIVALAKNWSWIGCGAIVVAIRGGDYWVIDGQHRLLAALRRSDIKEMPCIVFEVAGIGDEAQGFIDTNTNRKAVSTIAKHRALVVAGDATAIFVDRELSLLGLTPAEATKTPGTIQCLGLCMKRAAADRGAFSTVLRVTAEISAKDAVPIRERLIDGLDYIHHRTEGGILAPRLIKRIREKGAQQLFIAANKAAAFYGAGGAKVWADGILQELNKGLINKFELEKQ